MDNIIQDFAENFIQNIEKYVDSLFEGNQTPVAFLRNLCYSIVSFIIQG